MVGNCKAGADLLAKSDETSAPGKVSLHLIEKELGRVELSETLLYRASLLEEAGEWKELLELLNEREKVIVDKIALKEMRGRVLMMYGELEEAGKIYKSLYERNPENHVYILCLLACERKFEEFWPALVPPSVSPGEEKKQDEDEVLAEPDKHPEVVKVTEYLEQLTLTHDQGVVKALKPSSELTFGATSPANVQSIGRSVHPSAVPVWGWMTNESSKYLQKATYKRIGKRLVKQKKPFLHPLKTLPEKKQKELLEWVGELRDLKKSESAERIALSFLTGELFVEKLKVLIILKLSNSSHGRLAKCKIYLRNFFVRVFPKVFPRFSVF